MNEPIFENNVSFLIRKETPNLTDKERENLLLVNKEISRKFGIDIRSLRLLFLDFLHTSEPMKKEHIIPKYKRHLVSKGLIKGLL